MTTRSIAILLLTCVLGLSGCGDDSGLSAAEREWCSFSAATEDDAHRFDVIFETGLGLGLDMDRINRLATDLRAGYEAEGMDADAAVEAVSDDLMEDTDFIAACQIAYVDAQAD